MNAKIEYWDRYGIKWKILQAEVQHNKRFYWEKILCIWSGEGPEPFGSEETHTFYTAHRPLPVSGLEVVREGLK